MARRIGPVATCLPLASPEEGSGMTVPALNGGGKPIFEALHSRDDTAGEPFGSTEGEHIFLFTLSREKRFASSIRDMVPLQGPSDNEPLYGFSHSEPGASTGRLQQPNAAFMAP